MNSFSGLGILHERFIASGRVINSNGDAAIVKLFLNLLVEL